jgi:hypothetical protein
MRSKDIRALSAGDLKSAVVDGGSGVKRGALVNVIDLTDDGDGNLENMVDGGSGVKRGALVNVIDLTDDEDGDLENMVEGGSGVKRGAGALGDISVLVENKIRRV